MNNEENVLWEGYVSFKPEEILLIFKLFPELRNAEFPIEIVKGWPNLPPNERIFYAGFLAQQRLKVIGLGLGLSLSYIDQRINRVNNVINNVRTQVISNSTMSSINIALINQTLINIQTSLIELRASVNTLNVGLEVKFSFSFAQNFRYHQDNLDGLEDLKNRLEAIRLLCIRIRELVNALTNLLKSVDEKIDKIKEFLEGTVKDKLVNIEQTTNEIKDNIQQEVLPNLNTINEKLVLIQETLTGVEGTLVEFQTATMIAFFDLSVELWINFGLRDYTLTKGFYEVATTIRGMTRAIGQLSDKIRILEGEVEKIPKKTVKLVTEQVVGESFYRYDTMSTYYLTIIFLFNCDGIARHYVRSQIKVRLPLKPEEITNATIAELKRKVSGITNLSYNYGDIRLNYLSCNKTFKTVINVRDETEGINVLRTICEYIDAEFNEENVTKTTGPRRENVIRRTTGIGKYKPMQRVRIYGHYRLARVALLVNGIEQIITLFSSM